MIGYLKKYWIFAVLAPLFMLGEVTMDLLQPRLMSTIVDEGVLGLHNHNIGDLQLVISTGLQMIGLVLIGCCCGILSGVFANLCSQNFGNDLRKDTFRRIMSFSFEQTEGFSTGSLITRVTNDITQVQNLVMQAIRGFVRTFLLFGGGIFFMLGLDLSFGVVVACALPLVILCAAFFIGKASPKFSVLQSRLDRVNSILQENLSGARVVKAYVKEPYEQARFQTANTQLVGTQVDILLLFSYMTPIMNIILNISVAAVIKVGAIHVQAGAITPGNVMAAITYVSQILNAVVRVSMIFQTISRGAASGKRINEVLRCAPVITDGSFSGDTKEKGTIEFRDVSFAYPGMGEEHVLQHINLRVAAGETIGILGSTGCGKSTLVSLIPRFYDVTEGSVLVDGVDVKDYRLKELRDKVSFALQKSEIFSASIAENIRWGKPEASEEELAQAASSAQAMEFIQQRSDGFETKVDQQGMSLSGGQKQRLAISRALVKPAEILILDDATSALDLRTEHRLYEALETYHPEMTKIIIAQRIHSVMDADRIVVLENGEIADVGTHAELLEKSEVYREIYRSQLKTGGETDVR